MQHGCMERLNRKRGPEVWQFRWSVTVRSGEPSLAAGFRWDDVLDLFH
jgi:hypothetical protein